MSWDVIVVSNQITDIEQLDSEGAPRLGSKSRVIQQLTAIFPDFKLTEPAWGSVIRPEYSIEFSFGEEENLAALWLHIRAGGSTAVIADLQTLCSAAAWRAFDTTTSEFLDAAENPAQGLEIWRKFRDRVTAEPPAEGQAVFNLYDYAYIVPKKKPWWQFWKK